MSEPEDIVAAARSWLGTPFRHQGRVKGVGVDCAGLVAGVAHELGLSGFDSTIYDRLPDGRRLRRICDREMTAVGRAGLAPGAVLLLRNVRYEPGARRHPQHMAIVGEKRGAPTMIHADMDQGRVVEHALTEAWRAAIVEIYRMPDPAA